VNLGIVLNRGSRQEAIFRDDGYRERFLAKLGNLMCFAEIHRLTPFDFFLSSKSKSVLSFM